MGVERFVFRRGTPAIICSDIGTNFVGAEKELRENIEKWNIINIAVELAHKPLSGGSTRTVRHTKLESGRGWYVVLSEYFTPSSVLIVSRTKLRTLLLSLRTRT